MVTEVRCATIELSLKFPEGWSGGQICLQDAHTSG